MRRVCVPRCGTLHDAGLEVILDVVYNHTAEGNELGPTFSFRGIDNAHLLQTPAGQSPALLGHDRHRQHARRIASAGAASRARLAPALGSNRITSTASASTSPAHWRATRSSSTTVRRFCRRVAQDPVLRQVKLIAEPWDLGPGGYRVGGFPIGWSEWNDQYRDGLRGVLARRPRPAAGAGASDHRVARGVRAFGAAELGIDQPDYRP